MKYLIILLLFLVETNVVAKTYNSENKLIIKSKNLRSCYVRYEDSIVIKRAKKINTVKLNIDEPNRLLIMNSKTKNYFFLYIEKGKNTIYIDLDNYVISSKTSIIANENAEVLRIKKHFDTLIIEQERNRNIEIIQTNNDIDTLSIEYHRTYYNWCIQHPKSFISLGFVDFLSQAYLSLRFPQEDINKLFESLDASLFNYPTYIECKKNIAEYINNPNYKIEEPPKPLWSPNQK